MTEIWTYPDQNDRDMNISQQEWQRYEHIPTRMTEIWTYSNQNDRDMNIFRPEYYIMSLSFWATHCTHFLSSVGSKSGQYLRCMLVFTSMVARHLLFDEDCFLYYWQTWSHSLVIMCLDKFVLVSPTGNLPGLNHKNNAALKINKYTCCTYMFTCVCSIL